MTAAETHALQRKAEFEEMRLNEMRYEAGHEVAFDMGVLDEQKAVVAKLAAEVAEAQTQVGGVVGRVPVENLTKLNKKLRAMAKRAAKVGAEAPTLKDSGEKETEEIKERGQVVGIREWAFIVVAGETPKYAGWTFLATLQHSEAGAIIRRVPGQTPEESEALEAKFDLSAYRDAKPVCDHCQTRRERKDTYLVVHEDGTFKQVGRNCIADFLGGQSPEAVLRTLEYLRDVVDEVGGDYGSAGVRDVYRVEEFLTHVACMIREYGWVPRSFHSETATADRATSNMSDLRHDRRDKKGQKLYVAPNADDETDAQKAREHALSLEGRSDFEHNLKVALGGEYLDTRNSGIAAAALLVYNRHIEREVERRLTEEREAESVNEHVGQKGDRLDLVLTVERVFERSGGNYGPTFITKMRDADGRTFTWFGSYEIDRGAVVTGKWTVKNHSEYQGTKETILTRPARDLSWEVPEETEGEEYEGPKFTAEEAVR